MLVHTVFQLHWTLLLQAQVANLSGPEERQDCLKTIYKCTKDLSLYVLASKCVSNCTIGKWDGEQKGNTDSHQSNM